MGVATLMILACHSLIGSYSIEVKGVVRHLLALGNQGVDLFLFLSGVGIYYSLKNQGKLDSHFLGGAKWYVKRYKRILIPYFLISVPYYIIICILQKESIIDFFMHLSTYTYWTKHTGAWYIAMLIPLYLIAPLIGFLIERFKYRWIITILLLFCLMCFGPDSLDVRTYTRTSLIDNIYFIAIRIPSFIIGYWLGLHVMKGRTFPLWLIAIIMIFLVITLKLFRFGNIYSWLIMPIAAILVTLFSICIFNLRKLTFVQKACEFMGKISLESYLVNIFILSLLSKLPSFTVKNNFIFYVCIVLLGTLLAYAAHIISNKILNNEHSTLQKLPA